MRQLVIADRIFEGSGNVGLSYYGRKILRTVFTGRNDKILHMQRIRKDRKYIISLILVDDDLRA